MKHGWNGSDAPKCERVDLNMPKKKILVLISNLDVGGMEMDLLRNMPAVSRESFEIVVFPIDYPGALAPAMAQQGVRVVGYAPSSMSGNERGEPQRGQGAVIHLRLGVLKTGFRTLLQIFRVAKLIRSEGVDAVHCFLPKAYFVGMLAAWLSSCRYRVMSRVNLNIYMEKHRLLGWLERKFLHRSVTRIAGNSMAILEELKEEGVPPQKLCLLYNGIDASKFRDVRKNRDVLRHKFGLLPDELLITVVGNLHSYKGHQDFLEALLIVRESLPGKWVVWIAGRDESGNQTRYEAWCENHNLDSKVFFLGARSDIPALLAAADLHVHPSHQEGLPNSVLEAMASGLPVIATAVGGIPELIEDNVSGCLVPPRSPAALAATLLRLLKDVEAREKIGSAASERVAHDFSIEASVHSYERLYGELFDSSPRACVLPGRLQ